MKVDAGRTVGIAFFLVEDMAVTGSIDIFRDRQQWQLRQRRDRHSSEGHVFRLSMDPSRVPPWRWDDGFGQQKSVKKLYNSGF